MARAARPDPAAVAGQFAQALALHQAGRLAEAEAIYRGILAAAPAHFDAVHNLGLIHYQRGEHIAALRQIDAALRLDANAAAAHNNRGVVLVALQRLDEALESYDRAIAIKPDYVDAVFNRGNALKELQRLEAALACYEQAIALARGHVMALGKRGDVLHALQRFEEAIASYDAAIALKPDYSEAWNNRGSTLAKLRRLPEAAASCERALALKPDNADALSNAVQLRMQLCDWRDFDAACARLAAAVTGEVAVSPFALLACESAPAAQLRCARTYIARKYPRQPVPLWRGERYGHGRIRVAYLSGDFRDHPVAHLTAGLFARHDRTRFETIGVSFAHDGPNAIRQRLEASFDRFIDVRAISDREVASLLRDLEADIVVDLGGLTDSARTAIFAHKPTPVHVNYLGYAGTLGADYCDYIIADPFVVPEDARAHFAEAVVYLPETFMVTDAERSISAPAPSRAQAGLPDAGFVFCCFNNTYKITPGLFDLWMRLLGEIDGAVLWLSTLHPDAADNLRREAMRRGVEAARLVFAPKVPRNEDHLARIGLADLFLDTVPYNAHTTAADALWAGLPVLTCTGATFASRVAGSLLGAVGLPELIASSLADYEGLALQLARDPHRLAALRARLARSRSTCALFDTARFTRHLEAAYTTMRDCAERGERPQSFAVGPIERGAP